MFTAALMLLGSTVALADGTDKTSAPSEASSTETIQFVCADLDDPDKLAALYQQIRRAAKRTCAESGAAGVKRTQAELTCRQTTVGDTVARIDVLTLTKYHLEAVGTDEWDGDAETRISEVGNTP